MKNILKEVDKILIEVRQEGKGRIEGQNRVGLLKELIKRTQEKQITLVVEGPPGRRKKLMVSQRGVYIWDEGRYMYDRMIDLTEGNKGEAIEIFANSSKTIGSILQEALTGKVEIEIT